MIWRLFKLIIRNYIRSETLIDDDENNKIQQFHANYGTISKTLQSKNKKFWKELIRMLSLYVIYLKY
jgi:hypothetical protein